MVIVQKSEHTEVLLAVTPNGIPCFVSDCYGGRLSDKEISHRSGLLATEHFEQGDAIVADRGFDIADLLCGTGIELNMPPFLNGRDHLDKTELIETRRIISLCIHIERAIKRVKNYRILSFFASNFASTSC